MLSEIFAQDRWIRIAYKKLESSPYFNPVIVGKVGSFLSYYANAHNLAVSEVIDMYYSFTKEYSIHIREFLSTGKYPFENGLTPNLSRIHYDIVLILSVVVSIHRHRIFSNILNSAAKSIGNISLIGIGSGLELEFIDSTNHEIDAFDISISQHIKTKYSHLKLHEDYFTEVSGACSNIYAIELVEHLSDPMEFIKMVYSSLAKDGRFMFTTATNVPQIDHLYNFSSRDQFESDLEAIGFQIDESELLPHDSIDSKLDANNVWYILKK